MWGTLNAAAPTHPDLHERCSNTARRSPFFPLEM